MTAKQTTSVGIIEERTLLNKEGSSRSTFHVVVHLDNPIEYKVGDSVAIYPKNPKSLVEKILHFFPAEEQVLHKKTKETVSLKYYLESCANLNKLTSSLLKLLNEKKQNSFLGSLIEDKEKLSEYLATRDLLDILQEYPNILSSQEIVDKLLPLMPRFYSIASSYKKDPFRLHLTVAHVSYEHHGRKRLGIGSHFLCEEAEISSPVSLYIQSSNHFTLPKEDASIIMIGPGTGIAPFKGFLEERLHTNAPGKNWLFFGERNRSTDFYYEEFFKDLSNKNLLNLTTAFSRDQNEKIYVQHKLEEHAKELFTWLEEGAYVYVCGDAKKMAKDVEKTLLKIIQFNGNLSEEKAKEYLTALKNQKRYLQDIY